MNVAVCGDYAYVTDEEEGLYIADVSNPAVPVEVGRLRCYANDVEVSGDYAYVATGGGNRGLSIANISNPANPVMTGYFHTSYEALNVAFSGDYAYVTDGNNYVRIVDVSQPANPVEVSNISLYATGLAVFGDYLYVAKGYSGLQIFNVSNPAIPVETGRYNTPEFAMGIAAAGNYAYVADRYYFEIYDCTSAIGMFALISITPLNPNIIITGGGGSFAFSAEVRNTTASPLTFDVWSDVTLPRGSVYGPLLLRTLTLPGLTTVTRELTQQVPSGAPVGFYSYNAYIGTFPDSVVSGDDFPFLKIAGDNSGSLNSGWNIYGWDNDEEVVGIQASGFGIQSCCPNPFNNRTVASFELRDASQIMLAVYDISGREIAVLAEGYYPAGMRRAVWDAVDAPSGVYFLRLQAGSILQVRKAVLVK